jgi:CRISPR-associated protein (TIGR03986 family)
MAEHRKGSLVQQGDQWFIRDEQDGAEARIPEEMISALSGELEPGAEVKYTRRRADKKSTTPIVRELRFAGEIRLLPNPVGGNIPDGFVNPYNFVPLSGHVPRTSPTSHEYFRGYSGRLTCSLTLKTPFFTPDSEGADKNQDDHETLRLLRDPQGRGFIPGSALKGMIRSVAEVLSNSCLSVADLEARFSWREVVPSYKITTKSLETLRSGDVPNDALEKLQSLQDKEISGKKEFIETLEAALGKKEANKFKSLILRCAKIGGIEWHQYWKNRRLGRIENLPREGKAGLIAPAKAAQIYFEHLPENCKDDDPATAEIETDDEGRQKVKERASLGHDGPDTPGYLKITEVPEDGNKRSQRFVYDVDLDPDHWLSFDVVVERAYNRTTEASRDLDARRRRIFRRIDDEYFTESDQGNPGRGLRRKRHHLEVGDTVYYVSEGEKVVRLGPVELSRVLYENGVEAGIPEEFTPCKEPTQLCPCCRVFGWIPPSRRKHEREEEESRAGFVSISPALTEKKLTDADIHEAQATLKPLGQPHASAMNFYLQEPDTPEEIGHYNEPPFQIRGRKFYWHQPGGPAAYADLRGNDQPKRDNQNKTVELLKPGSVFQFNISFENLNAAELGLLLASVQPSLIGSHQFYHKIGMGKPLGLGSAEVRITQVELIDRAKRYGSLWETGIEQPANVRQWASAFLDEFVRQALRDQQEDAPADPQQAREAFAQLPQIEPLLWMLDWKHKPSGVSYPPGPPRKVEESFRWFMEFKNKSEGRLLTPQEIIGTKAPPKRQPPFPESS